MDASLVLKKTPSGYEVIEKGENTSVFDTQGRLTSIKDRSGNTVTLNYEFGRLASVKDVTGREVLTFTYTGKYITTATDISGRKMTYQYDGYGNMTKAELTANGETTVLDEYDYDLTEYELPSVHCERGSASGPICDSSGCYNGTVSGMICETGKIENEKNTYHNLIKKTNAAGESYTISYVSKWRNKGIVQSITDPSGRKYTFTSSFDAGQFSNVDYNGIRYDRVFNDKGKLVRLSEIGDDKTVRVIKKIEYLEDRVEKTTDEAGNITSVQKDEWGNIIKRTDGEETTWKYTYDGNKRLTSETDPLGTINKYEYGKYGNKTKEIMAAGTEDESTTTYTYNQYNELTSITKGDVTTTYSYNDSGKITEIKDPIGNTTTMTYDAIGNMLSITDPNGNKIEFTYDGRGNRLTAKDPEGNTTAYTYNGENRMTTATDPKGNKTTYEYDFKGRVTAITDALNNRKEYQYDGKGNLIKITEGEKITAMTYDPSDRLTSITDAAGNTTRYEYTTSGTTCATCGDGASTTSPGKITDPMNNETLFSFDKNSRIKTTKDPMGGTIAYTYDVKGNLTKVTDARGNETTYEYDKLNRLIKTISTDTGTTTYIYNSKGNIIGKTDAKGITISYEYDAIGRITAVKYPDSSENITYTYDKNRLITETRNYDKDNRITAITSQQLSRSYAYDKAGNILTITDNTNPTMSQTFSYDNLYRLTTATGTYGTQNYEYDTTGNRTKLIEGSTTKIYSYQATNNQLQTITNGDTTQYSYDENGNTTAEAGVNYIYNQNQRLIKVTENNTTKGEYVYNGKGQRVKKTVNGQTTIFHYDQRGRLIGESTDTGQITAEYVYLNGQPYAKIENNSIYYYHNDHLGTPQRMTDATKQIVWESDYEPFGKTTIMGTITNNLRFPGQYQDQETGLHQNYFRDYNPSNGTYVESDPIGINYGENHLYVYSINDPINKTDPKGKNPQFWITSIAITAVGATAYKIKNEFDKLIEEALKAREKAVAYENDPTNEAKYEEKEKKFMKACHQGLKAGTTIPHTSMSGPVPTSRLDIIVGTIINIITGDW